MPNILLEANNITKIYDTDLGLKRGKNQRALDSVNFILEEGDFSCLMGPSGSGKSTLLNCLSTLDFATIGEVFIDGVSTRTLNNKLLCDFRQSTLGFIFQNHNLIPYLSMFDNIVIPASLSLYSKEEIKERAILLAKRFDIENTLDKFPGECSGGECQRAAIARALINNPKILLCDEPTGNLDSKNSHHILRELVALNNEGVSIVLVTHDNAIASYSKKLFYLVDGTIQTVIHKNGDNQNDYLKKIIEVTSLDEHFLTDTKPSSIKEESIETKKTHRRQKLYFVTETMKTDKNIVKANILGRIDKDFIVYSDLYGEPASISIPHITKVTLGLSSKFSNFGILSQYVFTNILDIHTNHHTYKFSAANKDDYIEIIQFFKNNNIIIEDPREIIESYKLYPHDYERSKYYQRTQKDLTKYKN